MNYRNRFMGLMIGLLLLCVIIAIRIEYTQPVGDTLRIVWDDKVTTLPCGN